MRNNPNLGATYTMWIIPRIIVNRILDHAQRSLPNECVGILSGDGKTIHNIHPLTNQLQDRKKYQAEPSQQIKLLRQLRETGLKMVAIYHSHPQSSPEPSETDLKLASYPGALHLIVSLQTDGCMEMNGYLIENEEAIRQEMSVID